MERLLHPVENLHFGDQSVTFYRQMYVVRMRNTSSNASALAEKLYVLVCQMEVHWGCLFIYGYFAYVIFNGIEFLRKMYLLYRKSA